MKRGDVYLVKKPTQADRKRQRAFVIVSRQALIDSSYQSVICAPVYSKYLGLQTQVEVGEREGLKHDSAVHCDGLVSLAKSRLIDYKGALSAEKLKALDAALRVALEID
ncbi:MAG: type II toxin-antitoxin system PemK/MazF family toxin [Spirochaetales bacterium]